MKSGLESNCAQKCLPYLSAFYKFGKFAKLPSNLSEMPSNLSEKRYIALQLDYIAL